MIPFQGMASRSLRKTLLDFSNIHTLKRQRKDLLLQVFDTKCFQKRELGPMPGVDWNKPKCFWQHRNFHAGIIGGQGVESSSGGLSLELLESTLVFLQVF